MLLVQIDHVTAGYDSKKDVLIDVSLQIAERDFLCIVGPNGGGKTTLLRVLLGLLKPRIGAVNFYRDGQPIPQLPMGYLPQVNAIDRRFPISVAEVVASGFLAETRGRRCSPEQRQRVEAVLARMGLKDLSASFPAANSNARCLGAPLWPTRACSFWMSRTRTWTVALALR